MIWADNTYRVVLFGHRDFYGHRILDDRLYPLLKDLLRTKPFVEIYIGRNGEFDIYAATVVKSIQNAIGKANSELICVLPYPEKDMEYYEKYYDDIIIYEAEKKPHFKRAITERNRFMIDMVDLVIAYVDKQEGGHTRQCDTHNSNQKSWWF
jgi:hypothetical protein